MNNIAATDSYKFSHFLQYPPGTQFVNSYIEPRGVSSTFPTTNEIVSFGVQGFVRDKLHKAVTKEDIEKEAWFANMHGLPFNKEGWKIIVEEYGGFLPVKIEALPEGTVFPLKTCQVQVINNDERLPWLTSYIETALLRAVWYPSTVATLSREIKKVMKKYLDDTCDDPETAKAHLEFMLHDFGARGATSAESAAIGGAAHAINFSGSDTFEAISYIRKNYCPPVGPFTMPIFSVPAAEHSTITSWLDHGGEIAAFRNMINQFSKPHSIYAVVSDSYDIYHAVQTLWGKELKNEVLEKGGRLVIRPDSGDPKTIVMEVLHELSKTFGYTINNKGFLVLHPAVRVIQGDGVDYNSIKSILEEMKQFGFAAENVVFGMGGALLQKVNRDSLKYAMKASAICVNGKWSDVYKNPITDKNKVSKRGRLKVTPYFETVREEQSVGNILKIYWNFSRVKAEVLVEDFEKIRERASIK